MNFQNLEDIASIGFRDDDIYHYIKKLTENNQDNPILNLECMNREETIKTFEKFLEKRDKTIY